MIITDKHIHILRHALGLSRSLTAYRNRFCTGDGSKDFQFCEELVLEGLMKRSEPSELTGGDYFYWVTDAGQELAEVNL